MTCLHSSLSISWPDYKVKIQHLHTILPTFDPLRTSNIKDKSEDEPQPEIEQGEAEPEEKGEEEQGEKEEAQTGDSKAVLPITAYK